MAKLTLNDVTNFSDNSTAVATTNANNAAIETAVENTLSRDGTAPNAMNANLDMNSNRIINLPAPVSGSDAARYTDVQAIIADGLPDQTGHAGEFLTTDGTIVSWDAIVIPDAGIKVSANDTTTGTLEEKLLASGLLGLTTQNDGGNETRTADVPIASQAEAEAGASNTKAMTPLRTDQYVDARLAAQSDATTGTDNDKLSTSLRVAQAIQGYSATQRLFAEGAAPSTPAANTVVMYAKSDGRLYMKDDAGNEVAMFSSSVAGAPVELSRQTASSSASLSFTGIDSTYDVHIFDILALKPATDDVSLGAQVGTGGTPTYDSANHAYGGESNLSSASSSVIHSSSGDLITDKFLMTSPAGSNRAVGNAATESISGQIILYTPSNSSKYKIVTWQTTWIDPGGTPRTMTGGGAYTSATAITALRFAFNSGNITDGTIVHRAIRK